MSRNNVIAYRFAKEINAPLDYVFQWCTDFSEDDPKITGSSSKRIILEKMKNRAIYVSLTPTAGNSTGGRVYLVDLAPPKAWHMEAHGNGFDSVGEYRLTRISRERTRLAIAFKLRYYSLNVPTKEDRVKDSRSSWDKYVAALERDYANSIPT
ncbi:MAG TPA: hypothetical protein VFF30_10260 [Nitrososphaerales archaeon]|nr:hypothetical protein [Nitrososphaerales archaeon]